MPPSARPSPALIVRVVDLETTGSRAPEHGVCEVGWQDVATDDPAAREGGAAWRLLGPPRARLVHPGRPIPARTAAVHHLTDADVAHAEPWERVAPAVLRPTGAAPFVALAAHRAAFERKWCTPALTGGLPWACTWKGALRVFPDEPSHSNQGLRYGRNPAGIERHRALPAHRAGPDAYVTAHLLRDMLERAGLDDLLAWERAPALLARVPFGALRGRRWSEADDGFLDWCLAPGRDLEADARHTAGAERARRAALAGDPAAGGPPEGAPQGALPL